MTRPYKPLVLTHLINPLITAWSFPPLLQYQFLSLSRNILFTSFIGMSQLAPLLQGHTDMTLLPNEVGSQQLARLEQLARGQETESSRLLGLNMVPFLTEGAALVRELQDRIREWLVQSTVRADPLVREAMEEALRRRREQGGEPSINAT